MAAPSLGIDSYDGLVGELSKYLIRSVSDQAPTMIRLAEQQMKRDFRFVDGGELPVTALGNGTNRFPLPPGYRGMRSIRMTSPGDGYELTQVALAELPQRKTSGYPTRFAIDRDIVFDYPHTLPMEMVYYNQFEYLHSGVQQNWLLISAPDAYLYGSLMHGGVWVRNKGVIELAVGAYELVKNTLIDDWNNRQWTVGRRTESPNLPAYVMI